MRHALAFIASALIHAAVFAGVIWVVNTNAPKNQPKTEWRTLHFDMGEMVITQQEKPLSPKPAKIPQSQPSATEKTNSTKLKKPTTQAIQSPIRPQLKQSTLTKKKTTKPSAKAQKPKKKITQKQPKKLPKTEKKPKKTRSKKSNPSKKNIATQTKTKPQKSSKKNSQKTKKKAPKAAAKPAPASNLTFETFPLTGRNTSKPAKPQQASQQAVQPSSPQASSADSNAYRQQLHSAINRAASRTYPKKAKRMKKQGTVRIQFNLSNSGRISNIKVVGSSGEKLLDQAGKKAVERLGQYKKPPAGFPQTVVVPIRFSLR